MISSARTPLTAADENSLLARSGGRGGRLLAAPRGASSPAKAANAAASAGVGGAAADDPTKVSKTPRTHGMKTRRAFGDISNRKAPSTTSLDATAGAAAATAKDGSIRRTVVIKKAVAAHAAVATTTAKKAAAPPKTVSFAMDVEDDDDLVLGEDRIRAQNPRATPHAAKFRRSASRHQETRHHSRMEFDFDEEVELPAGRLWIDQPWLDDDDDVSIMDLSLEGAATAREDLLEDLEHRHRLRLEKSRRDDENALRAVQEDVESLLRSEELLRFTPPSPASSIASFSNEDLADVWCSQQDVDDDSIGDPLSISF